MSEVDSSTKHFNTAIIATKISKQTNYSANLNALVQSPAFHAILNAISEYAKSSGLTEEQAAESVVQTFREIDRLWNDYIFQEGLEKLKGQLSN